MQTPTRTIGTAVTLAFLGLAWAQVSQVRADTPAEVRTRVDVIPAHQAWTERSVEIPAVTQARLVPVFETRKVPVFETRRVPVMREVQEPVLATREVPVFAERPVAERGAVAVPTYEHRTVPVTVNLWNPFGCDDFCVKLWDRCECVPTGSRIEEGVVAWRTERVQTGTRTESYVTGTQTRTVQVGERTEQVQVGEREETVQTGMRTELFTVTPARTETRRECVDVAAERVTVLLDTNVAAANVAPAEGTRRVVTEDEFRKAQAATR